MYNIKNMGLNLWALKDWDPDRRAQKNDGEPHCLK